MLTTVKDRICLEEAGALFRGAAEETNRDFGPAVRCLRVCLYLAIDEPELVLFKGK
jgi:hypothetical protein